MVDLSVTIFIFLFMTIVSPACTSRSAEVSSWSVQVKTSGGFSGRGNGNVLVTSDGKITYEKPALPKGQQAPCEGKLSKEELRSISEAVAQTEPGGWHIAGLNVAAPDAFGYVLELRRGKQVYQAHWYDNTREKLPGDLTKLFEAISLAQERTAKKCEGRQ